MGLLYYFWLSEFTVYFFITRPMNLTPKQQWIQEEILKRLYPWKSLEEAKQEELKFWCKVTNGEWDILSVIYSEETDNFNDDKKKRPKNIEAYIYNIKEQWNPRANWRYATTYYAFQKCIEEDWYEIIWLPPTLPRVMTALWNDYRYQSGEIMWPAGYDFIVGERKLLNDDNTECTLFDQPQDTQDSITALLWRKE